MRSAIIGDGKLEAADNRRAILLRHLYRKNVGYRTILITSADKRISSTHHEKSATAVANEVHDHLQLILGEKSGLDAAENEAFVLEKLFALFREALGQHLFLVDALTIELVLGGAQQGDEPDIGIVLNCTAQEFELPPRFTFYIEDLRMVILDFDQCIQGVVLGDAIVLCLECE